MSDVPSPSDASPGANALVPVLRQPTQNRLERMPDADPPEQLATLAGEYIGLSIAGGLVLGLVVGSLIPRAPGRKLSRGASALASIAAQAAMILARQAIDKAGAVAEQARDGAQEGRDKWQNASGKLAELARTTTADRREAAGRMASQAASAARESAKNLAEIAIKRLTKTSD